MPSGAPDTSQDISVDGSAIILDFERTSDTGGVLKWKIPQGSRTYDGILITGSLREINPSNFPTDSVKYVASQDFSQPADRIGNAQVIVALYRDKTTTSATVTGLDPDEVYFFSAHLVTNVLSYWQRGVRSYPQSQQTEAFAGDVPTSYGPPANPTNGQMYYDPDQNMVFIWDATAATWKPTTSNSTFSGETDPPAATDPTAYPKFGDFFYNTRQKILKTWNGTSWIAAESKTGEPTYGKTDVGTNQSYIARANLIDILRKQLGYPVVCVELTEDHFNIAIDNALQEIRRRTDTAYAKQYFFLQTNNSQDIYYLNDKFKGTNTIVDVLKVHRIDQYGLSNFAPDNILAQQFLNQFYSPGHQADLVSIHLVHAMSEIYRVIFAGEISFNWRESYRELKLYRRLYTNEKILLECSCEKMEQEILVDRWMQQWVQAWAEAELMLMLAHIRGKYATLPGPGGGMQLNADTLISQAQALQEDCLRQIRDMEVGQNGPDNWYVPFAIG